MWRKLAWSTLKVLSVEQVANLEPFLEEPLAAAVEEICLRDSHLPIVRPTNLLPFLERNQATLKRVINVDLREFISIDAPHIEELLFYCEDPRLILADSRRFENVRQLGLHVVDTKREVAEQILRHISEHYPNLEVLVIKYRYCAHCCQATCPFAPLLIAPVLLFSIPECGLLGSADVAKVAAFAEPQHPNATESPRRPSFVVLLVLRPQFGDWPCRLRCFARHRPVGGEGPGACH